MINESLKNESLINKLDENMISENIFEYLYLEDINHLSQTNKKINQLFKKSIKNNLIKNITKKQIYIQKKWDEFPQYVKIIDYSTNKNYVKYKFIPTGCIIPLQNRNPNFGVLEDAREFLNPKMNIHYPIPNHKTYILSKNIKNPQFILPIVTSFESFYEDFHLTHNNSSIVYSIQYLHPHIKKFIFKIFYNFVILSLYFLLYVVFIFFSLLIKGPSFHNYLIIQVIPLNPIIIEDLIFTNITYYDNFLYYQESEYNNNII